mmetsp:Transcript_3058/g.7653  ORF Transcript_3058/g.7653 Transcript_3058/m.7653 type:complete len:602 (-) Transcript_3058:720-2525(-)
MLAHTSTPCAPHTRTAAPFTTRVSGARSHRRIVASVASAPVSTSSSSVGPRSLDEALELSSQFNKGFSTSLYTENSYWIEEVEGKIPEGLRGTLLRNGPGLFEVGSTKVPQPFDGDGMVCAVSFDGSGRAHFSNAYVRTEGFVAERRAGRQLYRSAFNRALPEPGSGGVVEVLGFRFANPLDIKIKDTANTNVLRWGGKTLALYERGMPWSLSSPDLATLGQDTLGNTVHGKYVGAHLRLVQDPAQGDRLVTFSFNEVNGMDGEMVLYEYDTAFNLLHKTKAVLPGAAFGFFHDIAVTPHYYLALENPITLDAWRMITQSTTGKASIVECLQFDATKKVKLHLIPRPGSGAPEGVKTIEIPTAPFFTFHHSNAYEVGGSGSRPDYLVLDSVSSDTVDFANNVDNVGANYYGQPRCRNELRRLVVDLRGPQPAFVRHFSIQPRACEFPVVPASVSTRAHTHTYIAACGKVGGDFFGPLQGIAKISTPPTNGVTAPFDPSAVTSQFWQHGGGVFPSEVAFVPRSPAGQGAEDDGWLMSVLFDAKATRSKIVILDAQDLNRGPVATLHLPHHVPQGLHGMWTPDYLGPSPGAPSKPARDIRQGV